MEAARLKSPIPTSGRYQSNKVVSEADHADPQFVEARQAIANAERVIFLGFGFAPRNVERLQLHLIKKNAAVYISTSGMSSNQAGMSVHSWAGAFPQKVVGLENQDAFEFLRSQPQALS